MLFACFHKPPGDRPFSHFSSHSCGGPNPPQRFSIDTDEEVVEMFIRARARCWDSLAYSGTWGPTLEQVKKWKWKWEMKIFDDHMNLLDFILLGLVVLFYFACAIIAWR